MSKKRTAFSILGVTPADDMATIRMAWRAKVRRLHPDRAADKSVATAELAEVNAAFDALQGHVSKGHPKTSRRSESSANVNTPASNADGAPQSTKAAQRVSRKPEAKHEDARSAPPARFVSQEARVLSKRARAGYARALDVVAVA